MPGTNPRSIKKEIKMNIKTVKMNIKGMTCEHCAKTISNLLETDGILAKQVSFPNHSAEVKFDAEKTSAQVIAGKINGTDHYEVTGLQEKNTTSNGTQKHLIIIGGGSAAFAATLEARELGARVTMINDGLPIGGTCVNVGCVPSKNLIRAAESLHRSRNNPFPGIETGGSVRDFQAVMNQKQTLVEDLRQKKYLDIVAGMEGFELIQGRAELVNGTTVSVNGKTLKGDRILIATGARPHIPEIPGLSDVPYLTNKSAFELEQLPESILVLGGRYIALEIGQMFSRLGSRVTLLQRSDRILPTETADLTDALTNYLEQENMCIITGNEFLKVYEREGHIVVESRVKSEIKTFQAEKLIVAAGRTPNADRMGLEKAGVELGADGGIVTDEDLKTSVSTVYAAGDVTGKNMFVYTAAYEGKLAARNALKGEKNKTDYSVLPWVIFTDPQVTGVGLDEVQAQARGIDVESSTITLDQVPRSIAARDTRGFIKLIRDRATDKLVGARILAPEGSELIMEVSLAIRYGITVKELVGMFHPYLTLSEGIKLAAITFGKNVKQLSCCAT
jgi:mercuric reductase